jgi:hypothetical protein
MGAELRRGYTFTYAPSRIKKKIFCIIVCFYMLLTGKKYEGNVIQQIRKLKSEYKSSKDQNIVILNNIIVMIYVWFDNMFSFYFENLI